LEIFIQLLNALDPLVAQNANDKSTYIPRAFQPIANRIANRALAKAENKNELLGNLFRAANYLDNPFILNAIAAMIADFTFPKMKLPTVKWKSLNRISTVAPLWGITKRSQPLYPQTYTITHKIACPMP